MTTTTAALPPIHVVNKRREPFDVYIGRGGPWGNPFPMTDTDSREDVIRKFEAWFATQTHLHARLPELLGKRLGCFCAPKACHGDVLKRWAERA